MIALTALIGLIESILYYVILYYIGKILSDSQQLRSFFNLNSKDEQSSHFINTSNSVEKIGNCIIAIAAIGIVYSIITTLILLSNIKF